MGFINLPTGGFYLTLQRVVIDRPGKPPRKPTEDEKDFLQGLGIETGGANNLEDE